MVFDHLWHCLHSCDPTCNQTVSVTQKVFLKVGRAIISIIWCKVQFLDAVRFHLYHLALCWIKKPNVDMNNNKRPSAQIESIVSCQVGPFVRPLENHKAFTVTCILRWRWSEHACVFYVSTSKWMMTVLSHLKAKQRFPLPENRNCSWKQEPGMIRLGCDQEMDIHWSLWTVMNNWYFWEWKVCRLRITMQFVCCYYKTV